MFNWNGLNGYANDGNDVVGIIANELEPIMPYAVGKSPGKLEIDGPESEIFNFDVNAVTFALVNSVKELNLYVIDFEKRIKALENDRL
jgi:hypothetical protein